MSTENKILSVGDWMITLLLLYIPIVNIIAFIVFLVGENKTRKNFVLAQLMFFIIGLVLFFMFGASLLAGIN
ncbi:hypothetical protein RJG79_03420 [Mycoplasmatota bacterium WC44]